MLLTTAIFTSADILYPIIVSSLNNEETSHGPVMDHFVTWCQDAFLELNASKTKDVY